MDSKLINTKNLDLLVKSWAHPVFFGVCRPLILLFAVLSGSTEATIPGKIHQIWIGAKVPEYLDIVSQSFKKVKGWEYNLWRATQNNFLERNGKIIRHTWTESEYTTKEYSINELFDNEHSVIKAILERNRTSDDSHLASLGDILRYRIVHEFGGFYFDMKFELLNPNEMADLIKQPLYTLITANEFAFLTSQQGYLSNAFFAAEVNHPALTNLLLSIPPLEDEVPHSKVDIFGPAFFLLGIDSWYRAAAADEQTGWLMLPHTKIYPYIDWAPKVQEFRPGTLLTETAVKLREAGNDFCVVKADSLYRLPGLYLNESEYLPVPDKAGLFYRYPCNRYPNAIAIDHFDYGSSWNSHNRYSGHHR